MRPAGKLGSLPVSRCVQVPAIGSQSQTSARAFWPKSLLELPVLLSAPPTSTIRPRTGSYAMPWP